MLEDAEELRLGPGPHLANLVEEEAALVGHLELPELLLVGVGEGPLLVAEELALEEGLGDRRTVERDERAAAAGALVVDRLGDELLPRAALTGDEHGRLEGRDREHRPEDLLHAGRPADDVVELVAPADLAAQLLDLTHQLGPLGRLVEDHAELVDVEGLGDVVEGAELHGADRRLDRLGGGQHDDRQVREADPQLLEEL